MTPPFHARLEALYDRVETLEQDLRALLRKQDEILQKQQEILVKLARYEGGWGAVFMIVTALWSALLIFKDKIVEKVLG
jgi:hypothetical protein